jgi:hypothetical protein
MRPTVDDGMEWEYAAPSRLHDEFDPGAEPSRWWGWPDGYSSYERAVSSAEAGNQHSMNIEYRVFRRRVGPWELVEEYEPSVLFGMRTKH